jgi:uncharacterized phage protein (TIGR02218 family)
MAMGKMAALYADGLGERLTGAQTWLAICWRIVRQDGVALGFTTHDRPLWIAGLRHASAPGIAPSAIVVGDGLAIDTMAVEGALSATAITAADLAVGRWDAAEVELFMVDWRQPDAGAQRLARGTLGTVEAGTGPDAGFSATLRGPTAALAATAIESYSPECRAELGDRRCRVAMRGRRIRGVLAEVAGEWLVVTGVGAAEAPDYVEGGLRVADGPMAGIDQRIIEADGVWLRLDSPLALAVGVAVEVSQGCDKRFITCTTRFGNGANFRGEPHVPGGDVLTRFGGL